MRMSWAFVFSATIGLSRFPIYVFVRRPMRFYVQLIQRALQLPSSRTDRATTWLVILGWNTGRHLGHTRRQHDYRQPSPLARGSHLSLLPQSGWTLLPRIVRPGRIYWVCLPKTPFSYLHGRKHDPPEQTDPLRMARKQKKKDKAKNTPNE